MTGPDGISRNVVVDRVLTHQCDQVRFSVKPVEILAVHREPLKLLHWGVQQSGDCARTVAHAINAGMSALKAADVASGLQYRVQGRWLVHGESEHVSRENNRQCAT